MKLILTADVANLGGPGDLVDVKDGYGRNFLLPRGMAIVATRGAMKQVETIRRTQEGKRIRDLDHAREVAGELQQVGTVTVTAKSAGQGGKLFGSVTPADIVGAVRSSGGPNLDKRLVDIRGHIKTTGSHQVTVRLHPDVAVELPLEVQGA
jgi:large subunit ribosomal protein L9